MSRQRHSGRTSNAQLPFALKKELGIVDQVGTKRKPRERPHVEREEKRPIKRPKANDSGKDDRTNPARRQVGQQQQPKSILKMPVTRQREASLSSASDEDLSRASSPGLVLDVNSRSFRDRAAQDDAEVLALEKKLGMKHGRKLKVDDEFDFVLEGLNDSDEGKQQKREGEEWLKSKRRKAGLVESDHGESDDLNDGFDDSELGQSDDDDDGLSADSDAEASQGLSAEAASELDGAPDHDSLDEDDEEQDFPDLDEDVAEEPPHKVRENPYVAPIPAGTTKYVPPAARRAQTSATNGSDHLDRLRKQVQGHLNKLAESNAISILNEVEKLYQNNPRGDVTTTLIEVLLQLFCTPSALSSTFIILHAAFVTAVYKVVGIDFGAEFLSKVVEQFQHYHQAQTTGKEPLNLVSLLTHMFTFHAVSSTIVFDHIRLLLEQFNETNTEIVLRIIHDCGPQLRQEDPTALKSILQIMATSRNSLEKDGVQMSVRTKFMIERLEALRDNKMKSTTGDSVISKDLVTRLRKMLGSLNNRTTIKASDPMNITLSDIQNSEKRGKWWLIGASWKGPTNSPNNLPPSNPSTEPTPSSTEIQLTESIWDTSHPSEPDLQSLARDYGMNTSIRQSIFIALMSASDVNDGFIRLSKLHLKRTQQHEIPGVILRCARAEEGFNPYYTLLARKICGADKKMGKAFQFAAWDFLRRIGEGTDNDDGNEQDGGDGDRVSDAAVTNIATLFGHLILSGAQSITLLKKLRLTHLKPPGRKFVQVLLQTIFGAVRSKDEAKLVEVFAPATETPGLASGLRYFIEKKLRKSAVAHERVSVNSKRKNGEQEDKIRRGCRIALDALQGMGTGRGGSGRDDEM